MHGFIFYLKSKDGQDIEDLRQACYRLAGREANVVAEFVEGAENGEMLMEALELSSRNGATLVAPSL